MLKIEKILDIVTGEETIIEREETTEEKEIREALEKEHADKLKEQAKKAKNRIEVLAKLGLTEDEIQTLLP